MTSKQALEKLHKHSYEDMKEKIGCFKTIEKDLDLLDLILSKQVDIWLVNQCDYRNYVRIRTQSLIDSRVYCDDGAIVENQLTEKEFNEIQERIDNL